MWSSLKFRIPKSVSNFQIFHWVVTFLRELRQAWYQNVAWWFQSGGVSEKQYKGEGPKNTIIGRSAYDSLGFLSDLFSNYRNKGKGPLQPGLREN